MPDLNSFRLAFTDKLLGIAAENQGVMKVEAFRRYNTDERFSAMVNTIVDAAVSVLTALESSGGPVDTPLQQAFNEEVSQLLRWDDRPPH